MCPNPNFTEENMSEIQRFYDGQNVFITGGTGFMGKILVEKLLRSCPGVKTIYLLMRPKNGIKIQERVNQMTSLIMFESLRKINPDFQKKIVPLVGDAVKPSLGLSPEDRALIVKEVSIIFHVAATTRFDEPLKIAVDINVNSVMELIIICKECIKLKSAVYVSTAFSNCIYDRIEEKIYPTPMKYEDINKIVEIIERRKFSEEEENNFTTALMGKFPNTYTFTKSIAEGLVNENAKDLSFCIFRFSIALSTFKEPVPGWVDTAQGFNSAVIGIGIGAIRVLNLKSSGKMDIVPMDFACNALIASAWETGTLSRKITDDLPVYNYVSSADNPLTWDDFRSILRRYGVKHTPRAIIYYPDTLFIETELLHSFLHFTFHRIPSLLGDFILRLLGKKPILYKIYEKGTRLLIVTKFFTQRDWIFETENVKSMWKKLSELDKEAFNFDITSFDWYDVVHTNCEGVKMYLMKEDMSPESRKIAQRKYKIAYVIHQIIKLLFTAFILWIIWKIYCLLFN